MPAVKITLQYKRWSAFCEKGKIARKKFQRLKMLLLICCWVGSPARALRQVNYLTNASDRGRFSPLYPTVCVTVQPGLSTPLPLIELAHPGIDYQNVRIFKFL